jgi:hypothetical protein
MVGLMSGKFALVLLSLQAIYSGEIPFPLSFPAEENGVTQPKSGSFRATHGKERPTSLWVIFCATVS